MFSKALIISVQAVSASALQSHWHNPVDRVTTTKGSFLADHIQNDFNPYILKELEVYYNESCGFDWISFIKMNLPHGLKYYRW